MIEYKILTQVDMNKAGCDAPNCKEDHTILYMIPQCHKFAGNEVYYNKETGTLTLLCSLCGSLVATIKVAEKAEAMSHD